MELKLLANTEPRKRFHLIRRLRNAANHADSLEKLCQGSLCDARTKLEAQVEMLLITIQVPYSYYLYSPIFGQLFCVYFDRHMHHT